MTTPTTSLHLTSIVRRAAAAMLMAACGLTAAVPEAAARRVTPDEALTTARAILPAREYRPGQTQASAAAPLELVHTATDAAGLTDYYVFNRPADEGYVIVSGDTRLRSILAYSDTGSFDPGNIPPAMQAYLDGWQSEIAGFLAAEPAGPLASRGTPPGSELSALYAEWEPVEPLIKSKWNQSAPYNNDCPRVNGNRCLTGCVATAMAQIVRYYRAFNGSTPYSYTCDNIGQVVSYDYTGHKFDWDNMTDTYSAKSTAAQNAAVADLMFACGVAVDMVYGTGGSGGFPVVNRDGYVKRFGYDPATRLYRRSECTSQVEWETMIYTELSNGRPIQFAGRGIEEGHSFILDGTDGEGLYHFNWGWGGSGDGFFALHALQNGITDWNGGYSGNQEMIVVVPPGYEPLQEQTPEIYDKDKVTLRLNSVTASDKDIDNFSVNFTLLSIPDAIEAVVVYPTIVFTHTATGLEYSCGMRNGAVMMMNYHETISFTESLEVPGNLPAGRYRVDVRVNLTMPDYTPLSTEVAIVQPDSRLYMDVDASGNRSYHAETTAITGNFLRFDNVDYGDGLYLADSNNRFRCTLTNITDIDYAQAIIYVLTPVGQKEPIRYGFQSHVTVPAHDRIDMDIVISAKDLDGKPIPAGDYILSFTNYNDETVCEQTFPLTVHEGSRPLGNVFTGPSDSAPFVLSYFYTFTPDYSKETQGLPSVWRSEDRLKLHPLVREVKESDTYTFRLALIRPGTKEILQQSPEVYTKLLQGKSDAWCPPLELGLIPMGEYEMRVLDSNDSPLSPAFRLNVTKDVTCGSSTAALTVSHGLLTLHSVKDISAALDLTRATLEGRTVEAIGRDIFNSNLNLTSVTIPATVTTIGNNAFRFCRNLRDVTFLGSVPPMKDAAGIFYGLSAGVTFHVPAEAVDAYTAILADYGTVTAITGEEPGPGPDDPVIGPSTAVVEIVKQPASPANARLNIYNADGTFSSITVASLPAVSALADKNGLAETGMTSLDGMTEGKTDLTIIQRIEIENPLPVIEITTDQYIKDIYDKATEHPAKLTVRTNGCSGWESITDMALALRGRGNSTLSFPKKPYRLKAKKKFALHSDLKKSKNYVLLANYIDGTLMRNSFAMEAARALKIPYTPHAIPCDVILNGMWKGSYILCEKTGLNSGHIDDIDETRGILLELDTNVDPSDTYFEENGNYNIGPFGFPVAIKDPDFAELQKDGEITDAAERIEAWKQKFLAFEKALADGGDWTEHADLESAVRYVMLFNLCGNQELKHPKSVFIHARDIDSKFVFGHMWDFDWAFNYGDELRDPKSFYFGPYTKGDRDGVGFFKAMMRDPRFQAKYAEIWPAFVRDELPAIYEWMGRYAGLIEASAAQNTVSDSGQSTLPGAFRNNVNLLRRWIEDRVQFISTAPNFGLFE